MQNVTPYDGCLVTLRIGSDTYPGKIERVSKAGLTVWFKLDGEQDEPARKAVRKTRLGKQHWNETITHNYLLIGEAREHVDPQF